MSSRSHRALVLPWLALGGVETYFTHRSLVPHSTLELVLEWAALLLLGTCQIVLGRGVWRSPLLPAAAGLLMALMTLKPAGSLAVAVYAVGSIGVLAWLVRVLDRMFGPGVLVGCALALVAGVGMRYAVLFELTGYQIEALRGQAHAATRERLLVELKQPGHRSLPASSSSGPPLVLISIDTLRQDVGQEMTTYRRLAARGAAWPAAMSTSSWTLPATASLATGALPGTHGAGYHPSGHYQGIDPEIPTLAEELKAAGYATAAIAANPWVSRQMGFDRGFDRFVHSLDNFSHKLLVMGVPRRPTLPTYSDALVERAVSWVESAPATGWYLWIHVIDPHMPYDRSSDPRFQSVTTGDLKTGAFVDAERRAATMTAYREMTALTDANLAPLLDALEAKGVLDEGLVALTSDHGEELWEHDHIGHAHSHHGVVTDVPLVLVAPGLQPGVRDEAASIADIPSTFRAAAGLDARGVDLRQPQPPDRVVTAWGNLHDHLERSARTSDARLIVTEATGDARYFHLDHDPDEHRPGSAPIGDPLIEAVEAIEAPAASDAVQMDDLSALEALGYVGQ